ncbi:hypothetical protein FHEFKHOI_01742 [Candidatus Methanoperedenaceae archaeon GB50]|nr:hypothetical protein AIOGIFDO_01735 [Candidatus Methanoperedenaceae archaeon GB37]CAD7775279.1 hypothetical protein FHEFKHOI_01742 [Candidatus Methanoperedenaceae archaeon GB50]
MMTWNDLRHDRHMVLLLTDHMVITPNTAVKFSMLLWLPKALSEKHAVKGIFRS